MSGAVAAQMNLRVIANRRSLGPHMSTPADMGGNWVDELVQFLRTQPGVSAVRIDPTAHKVSVATVGNIDLEDLGEKLAATIAAIEEQLAAAQASKARMRPGFLLRQDGGTT